MSRVSQCNQTDEAYTSLVPTGTVLHVLVVLPLAAALLALLAHLHSRIRN